METSEITIVIKNWIPIVIGIIGAALGIYNFVMARKNELKNRNTEEEDWNFYVSLIRNQEGNAAQLYFTPELGSHEHKIFERLAKKGLVSRRVLGCYPSFMLE